ncbi:hypothetical protein BS78_09G056200 [Paspalum vaginatum]|nr:hypothetical protein BS78_09G056200 [Paspalum vaginatum]
MGFSPPVPQQDSNWEIRAAVLLSLVLQVLLIFVAPVRKRSSSRVPRFVVWSCYLLADWVADLALGLLLNNLGNIGGPATSSSIALLGTTAADDGAMVRREGGGGGGNTSPSTPIIFAFWAPFLLLHLGGPDTITAYSLADNELWVRHLVGLLFEFSAAAVVFFCSLQQQQQQQQVILATVLMFVVGTVKYGERTYSLYFARIEPDPGPEYANRKINIFAGPRGTRRQHGGAEDLQSLSVDAQGYEFFRVFRFLYVNLILSFVSERRISHEFFMSRTDSTQAFGVIEAELGFLYDVKYTKAPIVHTRVGYALRVLGSCGLVASLLLFVVHVDKAGMLPVDVYITYALLTGAVALDAAALTMLVLSSWTTVFLELSTRNRSSRSKRIKRWWQPRRWSETITQMNVITHSLGRPDNCGRFLRQLANAADVLGLGPTLEDFIFIRQASLRNGERRQILEFIFGRIKDVASGAQSYQDIKKACDLRGVGAIDQKLGEQCSMSIRDSVTKDLDECLLLWHVATDLCLLGGGVSATVEGDKYAEMRETSRCLSEYMLYLLIKQSDMLSTVAGIGLIRYRDTCAQARRFFQSSGLLRRHSTSSDRLHDMARNLLLTEDVATAIPAAKDQDVDGDAPRSVLQSACELARELKKLDEETMWQVVTGVWGEMLTFVACRGRGSTHVQQLACGGELITMVSFLMNHLGLGNMY